MHRSWGGNLFCIQSNLIAGELLGCKATMQGTIVNRMPRRRRGQKGPGKCPVPLSAHLRIRRPPSEQTGSSVLAKPRRSNHDLAEGLRLRPDIPEVHLELGEVYAGAFQWAKAEEEFRAQVKLQPGNAEAAYRLGAALLEQGKAHEARVELMRADKLLPDMPETIYSLGKAASLEGDAASAEKEWTKLLAIEKESPLAAQAHFGLAGLYRKQRKLEAAKHEMQEFQRLQSGSSPPPVPEKQVSPH